MAWIYGSELPQELVVSYDLGRKVRTINFDAEQVEEAGYSWRWLSARIAPGCWDYAPIVAAIVRARYSDDEMQAIVNNYLLDAEAGAAEMEQMQAWRTHAKALARSYLEHYK